LSAFFKFWRPFFKFWRAFFKFWRAFFQILARLFSNFGAPFFVNSGERVDDVPDEKFEDVVGQLKTSKASSGQRLTGHQKSLGYMFLRENICTN
jgi:hypothetical protein